MIEDLEVILLELPEDALREAVVNAVCHRDYFEKGARVMVEIYDDRVEVVSPGGVCKGITRENFGTVSITRNSVIASMLFRINYIEQMGTGIMRMKNAAREAEVAEPVFQFTDFFRATFRREESLEVELNIGVNEDGIGVNRKIIGVNEDSIGVNRKIIGINEDSIGVNMEIIGVNETQRKILDLMIQNPETTARRIAEFIGIAKRNVISRLKSLGVVERIGADKSGHWVVKLPK